VSAPGPETARAQRTAVVAAAGGRPPGRHTPRPATGAGPRHNVPEAQRARLLKATTQIVGEVGYAQLSVSHLVARAEVARATFYELFSDREDIFLAALDEAVAQIGAMARTAYAGGSTWEERVRAGLETALGLLEEEPALARLCIVESPQAGPIVLQRRAEIVERLARVVDEGRGSGRGRRGAGPPPLTAHSLVAGALSVLQERLLNGAPGPLSELAGPLMSMIVFPYRGPAAAAKELRRPARSPEQPRQLGRLEQGTPLEDVGNRLTYRTVHVLSFVAEHPGANNREVGSGVGISDQGQISKLLVRLASLGLIENLVEPRGRGIANAWRITPKGDEIRRTVKL
jgi:TetR/AcrR family transcriptional regulator